MRKLLVPVMVVFAMALLVSACDKKESAKTEKAVEQEDMKAVPEAEEEAEGAPGQEAEEEGEESAEEAAEEGAEEAAEQSGAKPMDLGQMAGGGALLADEGEAGAAENSEGVAHFKEGHWDVAEKHFHAAIAANENLAEAHYNLALALDKLGNHGDATAHFGKALELAPDNVKISESDILKKHLGG